MTRSNAKPYEFCFVPKENMSLEFGLRMAGHRIVGGVCCSCGEPTDTLDRIGFILMRHWRDVIANMICCRCAQLPRDRLIEKATHVPPDVHLPQMYVDRSFKWGRDMAEANRRRSSFLRD